ncbi:MAG: response regulator, partial [bacterium]
KYGGTGLGLVIAKNLAELLGGTMGAESELGRGSEFWTSLPFGPDPQTGRSPATVPELVRDRYLLVVDDNATCRGELAGRLRHWGAEVEEAADAEAAQLLLEEGLAAGRTPEVCLVDLHLPEQDGRQFIEQLAGDPTLSAIPVVLMAHLTERASLGSPGRCGFSAFLSKPVRQGQLKRCLAVALGLDETRGGVASANDADGARSTREPLTSSLRVLVAEDNMFNRLVVVRMLERMGCRIEVADDGVEAVAAARESRYDIILMDCKMPRLDGYRAAQEIRQNETDRHVPIIALTANALEGDRERCLAAGMDDYLTKPLKWDTLLAMLKRWAVSSRETVSSP